MYGFNILALALGATFCTVVATETCTSTITVTVTVPECVTTPKTPLATLAGSSQPAVPLEPTELSSLMPPNPSQSIFLPPPGVPPVSVPVAASSEVPVAPSSIAAESSGLPVLGTTLAPSTAHLEPSATTSRLPVAPTAGAAIAVPRFGLGSLVGAAVAALVVAL